MKSKIDKLIEDSQIIKNEITLLSNRFKSLCKDESIDIDIRWNLLQKANELYLGNKTTNICWDSSRDYIGDFLSGIDNENINRGFKLPVFKILNYLKDNPKFNLTTLEETLFKTYCLSNFYTIIEF